MLTFLYKGIRYWYLPGCFELNEIIGPIRLVSGTSQAAKTELATRVQGSSNNWPVNSRLY